MRNNNTVYLVHCVDTEGPLYESPAATAERLEKTFGLVVPPTPEGIERARRGDGVPEAKRAQVHDFLSRVQYNATWSQLDAMLDEIMSRAWRDARADDVGTGYIFSWFVLDHVGFTFNPRRRALGYHSVYDHYRARLKQHDIKRDRIYWHFHPVSYFREAHKTSNNFSLTNEHMNVLSRRIIDYQDFPVAYRPGSHVERPDINLFLEQWIPFDYGNQGMPERAEDKAQADIAGGRYGDWRWATSAWECYHPDFYDYQKKGAMRRWIARCLNLDSRVRPITREEIVRAFARAASGRSTILSVTNHDEREMRPAIDWLMRTIKSVRDEEFGSVEIRHANAVEAIRAVEGIERQRAPQLTFSWDDRRLAVDTECELWGPQPFFCFKTHDQQYFHENLDRRDPRGWSFVFDHDSVRLEQLEAIGLATHDRSGNTVVCRISPDRDLRKTIARHLNDQDWIAA
jgi:hypothetical protein